MARDLVRFGDGQKDALVACVMRLLQRPDAAGRLMTAIGGCDFEEWLGERALDEGLAFDDVSTRRLPYDLVINGHRVQAKSSGSPNGVVDVRPVRPVVGSTCRRYALNDFDVLAVHLASYDEVYFVPVSEFVCDKFPGMVAGSFDRQRNAKWLNAWNVIAASRGAVEWQRRLWG